LAAVIAGLERATTAAAGGSLYTEGVPLPNH
jgi:hypothetical protein